MNNKIFIKAKLIHIGIIILPCIVKPDNLLAKFAVISRDWFFNTFETSVIWGTHLKAFLIKFIIMGRLMIFFCLNEQF